MIFYKNHLEYFEGECPYCKNDICHKTFGASRRYRYNQIKRLKILLGIVEAEKGVTIYPSMKEYELMERDIHSKRVQKLLKECKRRDKRFRDKEKS
jgi:hypothetical protein